LHLDNNWNSNEANENIKNIIKKLNLKFHNIKVNWGEFKDLQISFLKASVPDLEIPTDHAILALLLKFAAENNINYILIGSNISTESILPRTWSHGHMDWKYTKNIHNKFGTVKLNNYYFYTIFDYAKYRILKNIKVIPILNYIDYEKEEAKNILKKYCGFKEYGSKHHESIYTRFVQGYILPQKFKIDKKRAHLSSLICSGQISREEALKEIENDIYSSTNLQKDKKIVLNKLGLSKEKFNQLMFLPSKTFWDYPSYEKSIPKFFLKILEYLYRKLNRNN